MKRKIITSALTLALAAGICGSVYAAEKAELQIDNPVMKVDSEEKPIDAPPVIVDGRTLVPVRAVVEAFDGSVDWDAETKTATLISGENKIELTIGSTTAKLNDEEETLDVAPEIIDERTMLPIRFVAEGFGFNTDWDAETKTVFVSRIADAEEAEAETAETAETAEENEESEESEETGGYAFYHTGEDGSTFVEMPDCTLAYDKNSELVGEFHDTSTVEEIYTDKKGKTVKFISSGDDMYRLNADGSKVDLVFGDNLELKDKKGNKYTYIFNDGQWHVFVNDSKGKNIDELIQSDDRYIYRRADGKELSKVISSYGDEPYTGYTMPDGSFVKCERDYDTIYLDEKGELYGSYNNWLVELSQDGKVIRDMKLMNYCKVLTDKDENEYRIYTNIKNESVFVYPDGKETVLLSAEQSGVRSTDETTVYNADDGNSFISDDGLNYTIKDKDGKETELEFKGYETAYKANDGTECKLIAVDDKYILTKADGTKTVLTASEGEG